MEQEERIKLYLKGYEEGQKEAWSKIKHMISRYEGWELKSRIESRLGTLYQDVKSKRFDLKEDPSQLFFDEEEKTETVDDTGDTKEQRELASGEGLLVIEEDSKNSIQKFLELISEDQNGLLISRDAPDKLMKRFEFRSNVGFIWLSKSSRKDFSNFDYEIDTVSPSNLQKLSACIGNFLKNTEQGVVFISGIPSIINYIDFKKVQNFIGWVRDTVSKRDGYFICSIPENSMKKKRLSILKAEFDLVNTG
ncbi:MAG: DUF835 domain-containing protein [Candidatus Saliniplasma sp.]